jgi:hypothetical protein
MKTQANAVRTAMRAQSVGSGAVRVLTTAANNARGLRRLVWREAVTISP